MKVTIAGALNEIKEIDKRIANFNPMFLGGVYKAKFPSLIEISNNNFKSKLKAQQDLLERRAKIKAAIDKANMNTVVEIAEPPYCFVTPRPSFRQDGKTIYELLVSKELKRNEIDLLEAVLKRLYQLHETQFEENYKLDELIQERVRKADINPTYSLGEELIKVRHPFEESIVAAPFSTRDVMNKIIILEDELEKLNKYIHDANCTTMIEIPD